MYLYVPLKMSVGIISFILHFMAKKPIGSKIQLHKSVKICILWRPCGPFSHFEDPCSIAETVLLKISNSVLSNQVTIHLPNLPSVFSVHHNIIFHHQQLLVALMIPSSYLTWHPSVYFFQMLFSFPTPSEIYVNAT